MLSRGEITHRDSKLLRCLQVLTFRQGRGSHPAPDGEVDLLRSLGDVKAVDQLVSWPSGFDVLNRVCDNNRGHIGEV